MSHSCKSEKPRIDAGSQWWSCCRYSYTAYKSYQLQYTAHRYLQQVID